MNNPHATENNIRESSMRRPPMLLKEVEHSMNKILEKIEKVELERDKAIDALKRIHGMWPGSWTDDIAGECLKELGVIDA